jgi:hypothetical protein
LRSPGGTSVNGAMPAAVSPPRSVSTPLARAGAILAVADLEEHQAERDRDRDATTPHPMILTTPAQAAIRTIPATRPPPTSGSVAPQRDANLDRRRRKVLQASEPGAPGPAAAAPLAGLHSDGDRHRPSGAQRRGHAIRPPGAPALAFASQFARPELASEGNGFAPMSRPERVCAYGDAARDHSGRARRALIVPRARDPPRPPLLSPLPTFRKESDHGS